MSPFPAPVFLLIFFIVFTGMFFLVTYLFSKRGWSDMAAKYRYDPPFEGTRVGLISCSVNGMNYKNSIVMKYDMQGLYLKPIFILRLFHAPVLIPWQDIKEVREKTILFSTFKQLVIGQPFVATLLLTRSTFKKIEHTLPAKLLIQ